MDEVSFIINATMLKIEKRIEEDVPIASVDKMIETIERAIPFLKFVSRPYRDGMKLIRTNMVELNK